MIIKNISDLQNIWDTKPEIRLKLEEVDGVTVGIAVYMISTPTTFDSPISLECRGNTFRMDTGEIICRTFHKFFNVGERPETQPDNLDVSKIISFKDKLDGSMLTPVLINDKIFWKTKKSFYSSVAIKVQDWWKSNGEPHKEEILELLKNKITPIYEFIAPDNRIVLKYEKAELRHLESRNMITGEYLETPQANIPKFKDCYELISSVQPLEEIEGYVFRIGNEFYKIKTKWYLDRHHLLSKFSVRSITDMVLDETIDDILGGMVQLGLNDKTKEIRKYQKEITDYMLSLEKEVSDIFVKIDPSLDSKQFAEIALNTEISGGLFSLKRGKSPLEFVKKKTKNYFYEKYKGIVLFMAD